jgi:hypothetical protein
MIYLQAMQNQALLINRFPPLRVLINQDHGGLEEKVSQSQRLSENTTNEDFQTFCKKNPALSLTKMSFSSSLKKGKNITIY